MNYIHEDAFKTPLFSFTHSWIMTTYYMYASTKLCKWIYSDKTTPMVALRQRHAASNQEIYISPNITSPPSEETHKKPNKSIKNIPVY